MTRQAPRRACAASRFTARWLCVLVLTATACVGPARTEPDYRADVANTAKTAASAVESALLTARAVEAGKARGPYVSRRLTEDEQTLQSTITAFGSVQPPTPEMDAVRAEVVAALEDASSVVGDMRIAAFRSNAAAVVEHAAALTPLAERLRAYLAVETQ